MLTRIEIDGFKTFENQAIDLTPFTAIIGNNAAGKSNLFDAIQLLSHLATRDVAEAMRSAGAVGCLRKESAGTELIAAIKRHCAAK